MQQIGRIIEGVVEDLRPRRFSREDHWRLESMAAELVQNSTKYGLDSILDTLFEIHNDLAVKNRISNRRIRIVEGLYARLVGPWVLG